MLKISLQTLSHEDKTDLSSSHRTVLLTVQASNSDAIKTVKRAQRVWFVSNVLTSTLFSVSFHLNSEGEEEQAERLPWSRGWVEPGLILDPLPRPQLDHADRDQRRT